MRRDPQHWMDLCKAAAETTNPDEFLRIVRELNEVLENEQYASRDLQSDSGPVSSDEEVQC